MLAVEYEGLSPEDADSGGFVVDFLAGISTIFVSTHRVPQGSRHVVS